MFLVAGFDTTSNSLTFVVKALGMYPKHQDTIREELISKMKADGRDKFTYEDVMEARWLEAFIAGLWDLKAFLLILSIVVIMIIKLNVKLNLIFFTFYYYIINTT